MSNTGKYNDTAPSLRAAGRTDSVLADTAAACFTEQERPTTPDEMRRFRKSFTGAPGKRIQHWGSENDPPPRPDEFPFGVKNEKGQGVGDMMGGHLEPTPMDAFKLMKAEECYSSSKIEPLGKSYSRKYTYPDVISKDPGFSFGLGGSRSIHETAAAAVCPPEAPSLSATEDQKEMYKRSHAAYDPGEQRKRGYKNWVDPVEYSFGASQEVDYKNGVAKAMNPNLEYGSQVKPTELMPASVADFRKVRYDDVGQVKNLGLGSHKLPLDHTYGFYANMPNEWGARECLQGNYTEGEQAPDPDLGRSLRRGCAPEEVLRSNRTFGIPAVRSDIMPPKFPSVADAKNYGNEPGARPLLYPQQFANHGVYEEDFLVTMPKDKLEDLCVVSGLADNTQHFNNLYTRAQRATKSRPEDQLSVESIRQALYAALLDE
mmetsp:Transcript_60442/g.143653  ORF Transcript_60442/g.143653 Transcript_60442/m.143653 type:complete len:430 (-) Transcript_60442:389-1678(-)